MLILLGLFSHCLTVPDNSGNPEKTVRKFRNPEKHRLCPLIWCPSIQVSPSPISMDDDNKLTTPGCRSYQALKTDKAEPLQGDSALSVTAHRQRADALSM